MKRFFPYLTNRLSYLLFFFIFFIGCSDDSMDIPEEEVDLTDRYQPDQSFKVVGYLPYYRFSVIPQIDFGKVDYVNIAFGNLDAFGDLSVKNVPNLRSSVLNIKKQGPRVMLSLGGGGLSEAEIGHWQTFLSDANRLETVKGIVAYAVANELDGIDVDFEGELIPRLGPSYNRFVTDLKLYLHAKGLAITGAMMPISLSPVIQKSALNAFDFINIMAYNARGLWDMDNPGQHSSLEFAQRSLDFWRVDQGIASEKLILGMPLYGIDFDPSDAGSITFAEIISRDVNLAYKDSYDQTFYNGIPTIKDKVIFGLEEAAGVMFWEMGQDAVNELSIIGLTDQIIANYPCSQGDLQLFYEDADGDGLGDPARPLIACDRPDNYVADLSSVVLASR